MSTGPIRCRITCCRCNRYFEGWAGLDRRGLGIDAAISAVYEFIEWWAALALGAGADEFLATQGDPFDTQADMLMATLGAMLAQALLARWHDRQLAALRG